MKLFVVLLMVGLIDCCWSRPMSQKSSSAKAKSAEVENLSPSDLLKDYWTIKKPRNPRSVPEKAKMKEKDICSLPPEVGPCRAYLERWFYNVSSRQCEMFVYGGCEGNQNRFDQEKTCERKCEESKNSLLSRSLRAEKIDDVEQKKSEDDRTENEMEEENVPINGILEDFHTTIRRRKTDKETNEAVENIMNQGPSSRDKPDTGKAGKNADTGKAGENADAGKPGKNADTGKAGEKAKAGKTGKNADTGKAGENADAGKPGKNANTGKAGEKDKTGKAGENGYTGKAGEEAKAGKTGENADSGKPGDKAYTAKADDKPDTYFSDYNSPPDSRKEIDTDYKWRYMYRFTTSRPWTWHRYRFTTSRPWTWRRYYSSTSRPWTSHRYHHGDARNLYNDIRNYREDKQDTSVFAIIFLSCLLVVFAVVILFISRKKLIGMVTGRRDSETVNSRTLALNADEARPLMKKYVA